MLQPLQQEYEEHIHKLDALNDIGNKCGGLIVTSGSSSRRGSTKTRKLVPIGSQLICKLALLTDAPH